MGDLALKTEMKPRLIEPPAFKTYTMRLPKKLGRVGFTKDPGEGTMFGGNMLQTNLKAVVRDPEGAIVEMHELGSGKVTNMGALALVHDAINLPGVATTPVNLFNLLKYHAWGISTTEATTDIVLGTYSAPTATEGELGVTTITNDAKGAPKIISTGKIKAEGTLAVTEWGIFNRKIIKPAQETATAKSATSITTTGTPYTPSSATAQGLVGYHVLAETPEEVWGFITSNTNAVITVTGWYKKTDGTAGAEPGAAAKFRIIPTMFDHRKFAAINVVSGNEVEFPWELTVEAGG